MRILFADKVFFRSGKDLPLRGVELFNFMLIRDLLDLGHDVHVFAVADWVDRLGSALGSRPCHLHRVRDTGIGALTVLAAAAGAETPAADVLLLGNVGKTLIPCVLALKRKSRFRRCVLIAHREATPAFVRMVAGLPGHVLAVNAVIAEPFRLAGHRNVHVDYGVTDADRFFPATPPESDADRFVNFVVLGMLDNAWKGVDTAVDAFRRLPAPVLARSVLHLVSYQDRPSYPEENIRAYTWMDLEEIPELLRGMDIMIVPSRDEGVMRETFSQSVVQGMLTGLPVLVSDLPILKEKVDRGGGFVFQDVSRLVDLMATLVEDPTQRRRVGEAARTIALDRYVWDTATFAEKYLQG